MMQKKNSVIQQIVGTKSGYLEVKDVYSKIEYDNKRIYYCICKCGFCGREVHVRYVNFKSGVYNSCGKCGANNSQKEIGITLDKRTGLWFVRTNRKYIGTFSDFEIAKIVNREARKYKDDPKKLDDWIRYDRISFIQSVSPKKYRTKKRA